MPIKRDTRNYVDNCLRDIRKGLTAIEQASRMESLENLLLRIRACKRELTIMEEVVTTIEDQQELEV